VTLHDRYGVVLAVVIAAGAVLAVTGLIRPRILPAVRAYLRLSVAAVALQVLVGLVLVAAGHRPSQPLHWFYGAATLLAIPLASLIGAGRGRNEPLWVMGGAVAALLFAFRAITTG